MYRKFALALVMVLLILGTGGCFIRITPPAISSFEALPSSITAGQSATLTWSVDRADTVIIQPNIGQVALTGSRQITPANTTTYVLTASNSAGSTTRSVVINVTPQVSIVSFTAAPSAINSGGSATLSWQVTGASSVTVTPGVGSVALSGSSTVTPTDTTTYTLTAQAGSVQQTATAVVTVNRPPIITRFSASPARVSYGGTSLLRWNVTGATRVRIEPNIGNVPASGDRPVRPESSTTYVLIAESECCVVTDTADVIVSEAYPPPNIPVVVLFNIEPSSIFEGDSATLQWTVLGAANVYIDNGIGEVAHSGSVNISPANDTIYTMTATNAYGYRTVSVGIQVFDD